MKFTDLLSSALSLEDLRQQGLNDPVFFKSDQNNDGLITYDELPDHPVKIRIPDENEKFIIQSEENFRIFATLITQSAVIRNTVLMSTPENPNGNFSENQGILAANWIRTLYDTNAECAPVLTDASSFGLTIFAIEESPEQTAYLLHDLKLTKDGFGKYFFTLHHDRINNRIFAELDGNFIDLASDSISDELKKWRAEILKGLFVLLQNIPAGHEDSGEKIRNLVEGLMLNADQDYFLGNPSPISAETPPHIDPDLLRRIEAIKQDQSPPLNSEIFYSIEGVQHPLNIKSEKKLNPSELEAATKIFQNIPAELFATLAQNGLLKDLSFEIVEPELVNVWPTSSGWGGLYASAENKIYFPRDYLTIHSLANNLSILIHELMHRFEMGRSENYFWQKCHEKTVSAAKYAYLNPAVSPYALRNVTEFIAECGAAYFNEGKDSPPDVRGLLYGPRSREELRYKHPEIYLAMRLFFTPENPWYGKMTIFNVESYAPLIRTAYALSDLDAELADVLEMLDAERN